jgi:hypothetical protein
LATAYRRLRIFKAAELWLVTSTSIPNSPEWKAGLLYGHLAERHPECCHLGSGTPS